MKTIDELLNDLADAPRWIDQEKAAQLLAPQVGDDERIVPALTKTMEHRKMRVRLAALAGLAKAGAVPALTEALSDQQVQVVEAAAEALAEVGPEASPAVSALTELVDHKQVHAQKPAIRALRAIGPAAAPALDALLGVLDEGDVRTEASKALEAIGPAALPGLLRVARDASTWQVRKAALSAVGGIGAANGIEEADGLDVVAALREALADESLKVTHEALQALEALGPVAAPALDDLIEHAGHEASWVRKAALEALIKVAADQPERVIPLLEKALDDVLDVSRAAMLALARLGGERLVEVLVPRLVHEKVKVADAAAEALIGINPQPEALVPNLIPLAVHQSEAAEARVRRVLASYGVGDVDVLARAMSPEHPLEARRDALRELKAKRDSGSVAAFRQALQEPELRREAIDALEELGVAAYAAIPDLRALLKQDPSLAAPINVALRTIDPPSERPAPRPDEERGEEEPLPGGFLAALPHKLIVMDRKGPFALAVVLSLLAVVFLSTGSQQESHQTYANLRVGGAFWGIWGTFHFLFPMGDGGHDPDDPQWALRVWLYFGFLGGMCAIPGVFLALLMAQYLRG